MKWQISTCLVLGLGALAACGGDGTAPNQLTLSDLAGTYKVIESRATDQLDPTHHEDLVADLGWAIAFSISGAGTYTYSAALPEGSVSSFTGSVRLSGDTLYFDEQEDFALVASFRYARDTLVQVFRLEGYAFTGDPPGTTYDVIVTERSVRERGTGPVTDDPRTPACQRGALENAVARTSSLGPGDCRSASANVFAEVWTLTIPTGSVATVDLTPVFDGVLLVYDENAILLGTADDGGLGDAESVTIDVPGEYLVVVAAFDPEGRGPYTIIADVQSLGLNGVYQGLASGTYAGFPVSANITFSIASTGADLGGTWSHSAGASGTLTGTLTGASFSFTLTETFPCPGTFTGSGTIEAAGSHLTGSFSGSDCGGAASLSFTADRI